MPLIYEKIILYKHFFFFYRIKIIEKTKLKLLNMTTGCREAIRGTEGIVQ